MDPLYYKVYDAAKKKENNFNIVEMKWYFDIRYNRKMRWVKKIEDGEEEVLTCESLGRTKLRWEYLGKVYETDESNISERVFSSKFRREARTTTNI